MREARAKQRTRVTSRAGGRQVGVRLGSCLPPVGRLPPLWLSTHGGGSRIVQRHAGDVLCCQRAGLVSEGHIQRKLGSGHTGQSGLHGNAHMVASCTAGGATLSPQ